MNSSRSCASLLILLFIAVASYSAIAQHQPTAKLTEAEVEQVRENAIFPDVRVSLYTKFVDERAGRVKDLTGRPRSAQRVLKIDSTLLDLTALMDELESNLDQYSDRHSDIRKSLKQLSDSAPKWLSILRTLPGESGFDVARKEAIESGEELSDQATRLLKEQDEYFATHKDERNQEREATTKEAEEKGITTKDSQPAASTPKK